MTNELAHTNNDDALAAVILQGDLSKLSPSDKVMYYNKVCESLGLNPLTKPFEYMKLQGKETLYARKDCTEQLRKVHGISISIVAREVVEDCYIVTARATTPSGRHDEAVGAVSIHGLKGEARANAMMKSETKAKRRVTLSIAGLGMLDEHEVETITGAKYEPVEHCIKLETLKDVQAAIMEHEVSDATISGWLIKYGALRLEELPESSAQKFLAHYRLVEEQLEHDEQQRQHEE